MNHSAEEEEWYGSLAAALLQNLTDWIKPLIAAIEEREKKLAVDVATAKMKEESTSIESARYVTVQHRGAGKTTALLQEADKKRRTLMIKAAEDAISGSIIDHKYFARIVSLDKRMPREAAILIIQAIIDGKIPAVSMSFL